MIPRDVLGRYRREKYLRRQYRRATGKSHNPYKNSPYYRNRRSRLISPVAAAIVKAPAGLFALIVSPFVWLYHRISAFKRASCARISRLWACKDSSGMVRPLLPKHALRSANRRP